MPPAQFLGAVFSGRDGAAVEFRVPYLIFRPVLSGTQAVCGSVLEFTLQYNRIIPWSHFLLQPHCQQEKEEAVGIDLLAESEAGLRSSYPGVPEEAMALALDLPGSVV